MKKSILLGLLISSSFIGLNAQTEFYYYFRGERIPLTVSRDYVNLIVAENFSRSLNATKLFQEFNLEQDEVRSVGDLVRLRLGTRSERVEYASIIESLRQSQYVRYVFPFFERGEGAEPIGTSSYFYIQLKNVADIALLERVAKQKNVQIVRQVPYMPLWYRLSVRGSSFSNSIEATNYFFRTGLFEEVDPAFMFNFRPNCANDPRFGEQWGLRNTTSNTSVGINMCNAWTITRGADINIAVIDEGIDPYHDDLRANFHPQNFNTQSGTSPSAFNRYYHHGTFVAGIIGAIKNNGLQVIGVAPESRIMRVSHDMHPSPTQSEELASGISWAWRNGADVINNSWGDQGGALIYPLHSSILENAIDSALRYGRSGKGTVVVFAAGNFGVIDYPASFHDEILVVGAVNNTGKRAGLSGVGHQLDVVAPGENILSTFNNNEVDFFNCAATSMAAPHVAGVAALILSVNPNLTQRQVRDIIERTAQRVRPDLYIYSYHPNRPNGTWNRYVGHGLVDAYAAVRAVPRIDGETTVCATGTFTTNFPISSPWMVTAGFEIPYQNSTTAVVRAINLTGQTGTLSTMVNGIPVTKSIRACNWNTAISGPNIIGQTSCQSSFTLSNLPSGATRAVWSSDGALTLRPGSGLHGVTFERPANVTTTLAPIFATIYCTLHFGETFYRVISQRIQIRPDVATNGFIFEHTCHCQVFHAEVGECYYLRARPPIGNFPSQYTWSVTRSTSQLPFMMFSGWNTEFTPFGFSHPGQYRIELKVTDACGESLVDRFLVQVVPRSVWWPGNCGGSNHGCIVCDGSGCPWCSPFIFSPNPVDDVLIIDLTRRETDVFEARTTSEQIFDIRLLNAHGIVVRQQRTQTGKVQFDVSRLPEGTYYLHIEHNGQIEKHQIIIQRN
ncbi:MAG: S8 family peptidase [Bacteroidales bacterium]|nr:S8 family peptidase [Bacteroidales bacterium]